MAHEKVSAAKNGGGKNEILKGVLTINNTGQPKEH